MGMFIGLRAAAAAAVVLAVVGYVRLEHGPDSAAAAAQLSSPFAPATIGADVPITDQQAFASDQLAATGEPESDAPRTAAAFRTKWEKNGPEFARLLLPDVDFVDGAKPTLESLRFYAPAAESTQAAPSSTALVIDVRLPEIVGGRAASTRAFIQGNALTFWAGGDSEDQPFATSPVSVTGIAGDHLFIALADDQGFIDAYAARFEPTTRT